MNVNFIIMVQLNRKLILTQFIYLIVLAVVVPVDSFTSPDIFNLNYYCLNQTKKTNKQTNKTFRLILANYDLSDSYQFFLLFSFQPIKSVKCHSLIKSSYQRNLQGKKKKKKKNKITQKREKLKVHHSLYAGFVYNSYLWVNNFV